ncbi:MAG: hypothetical protein ABSG84_01740 [Acidobacteriaceae bacterium]|jgi:hypothetical protein
MPLRSSIPLLLAALLFSAAGLAQTAPAAALPSFVSLRLLDADTGQPIPNLKALIYGDTGGKPLPISPLGDLYEIEITAQANLKLGLIASNVDTTEFTPCIPQSDQAFNIKQVQAQGIAPPNKCSKKTHPAAPGELVIFLRRTHWWERWKHEE